MFTESHAPFSFALLILCTTLKAVNMLGLLFIPANPTVAFWVLVPILMMDAQLNAGINIANQGFLLIHSPRENRTMFIAAGTVKGKDQRGTGSAFVDG